MKKLQSLLAVCISGLAIVGSTTLMTGAAFAGPHAGGAGVGAMGGMSGRFDGSAASHMSPQGRAMTNGPASVYRDFGRSRAADRMDANARATSNGKHAMDRDLGRDRAADRSHRHHRKHH